MVGTGATSPPVFIAPPRPPPPPPANRLDGQVPSPSSGPSQTRGGSRFGVALSVPPLRPHEADKPPARGEEAPTRRSR